MAETETTYKQRGRVTERDRDRDKEKVQLNLVPTVPLLSKFRPFQIPIFGSMNRFF